MARLRRFNEALAENVHAPVAERWVVHLFGVIAMFCALAASLAAGSLVGIATTAVGAAYLSWDGSRRYRRWSR